MESKFKDIDRALTFSLVVKKSVKKGRAAGYNWGPWMSSG